MGHSDKVGGLAIPAFPILSTVHGSYALCIDNANIIVFKVFTDI